VRSVCLVVGQSGFETNQRLPIIA